MKRMKNKKHKKTIRLCGYILCAAFFIALIGGKFANTQEKQKPQEEKEQVQKNKSDKNTKKIRVLLMTTGFKGTYHSKVTVSAEGGMVLSAGKKKIKIPSGKSISIKPDDARFKYSVIRLKPNSGAIAVESIQRGRGTAVYNGTLEVRRAGGKIVLINELPVEKYLCAVVPSEMGASYELEALKAQAVCARSYAYQQMQNYAYPKYKAHVNDSTAYQVYGNFSPAERSTKAVKETAGEVVKYKGKLATTYYYSTSCGRTTTVKAWGSAPSSKNSYLKSVRVKGTKGDYEKKQPWYRWNVIVSKIELEKILQNNTGKEIGKIRTVRITEYGPGGVALKLKVTGSKGKMVVSTENKIRTALAGNYDIVRQDGSKVKFPTLLPSAFSTIVKEGDFFHIKGGGFGHGIGMSQSGANEMARQGKDYKEILKLFYSDIRIEKS